MTQAQFLQLLENWIQANKQSSGAITLDTELFGSGLLDSFDFLDLIVHIESKTGRKIDLAAADPNEFSMVRGLWNLAVNKLSEPEQQDRRSAGSDLLTNSGSSGSSR
jgi:acyl carrier protein